MANNLTRNIIIGVIVIGLIAAAMMRKKNGGPRDNYSYYSYLTGGNGDKCIILPHVDRIPYLSYNVAQI